VRGEDAGASAHTSSPDNFWADGAERCTERFSASCLRAGDGRRGPGRYTNRTRPPPPRKATRDGRSPGLAPGRLPTPGIPNLWGWGSPAS